MDFEPSDFQPLLKLNDREGIQKSIAALDEVTERLELEGFSKVTFSLGLLNVAATAAIFFGAPGHFWVWYGLKCMVLLPTWLLRVSKVYNGSLFIIDYCWMINIWFCIYMILSFFDVVPVWLRYHFFLVFFASALGPLGWACFLLRNGLILHSSEKISSLFVHMTPTLVCLTILHFHSDVEATYPGRFPSMDDLRAVTFLELFAHGYGVYLAWLLLHAIWLLTIGVDLPSKGWNTVFHGIHVQARKFFTRTTKSENIRAHAALYLLIHCALVALSFVWPPLCLKFRPVHFVFAAALFIASVWNGASYYEYLLMKRSKHALQKMMDQLDDSEA